MLYIKFKICVFGDSGVGKTTLVNRYLTGVFDTNLKVTIGADFYLKKLKFEEKEVTLQIWDFSGEDKFKFLLPSYAEGSAGGIFMYDITRSSSIENCENWLNVLKKSFESKQIDIPLVMVGGKLDLEYKRAVFSRDSSQVTKDFNFSDHIECSAKTGENVEEIFQSLSDKMLKRIDYQ